MTERPHDGPLTWNVAGLLGEDPGAERVHEVEGARIDLGDIRLAELVTGHVRLVRTNRGILAGWDPLESTCRHASLSIL